MRCHSLVSRVRAPTLYWRFKNKRDLVDDSATQVLVEG